MPHALADMVGRDRGLCRESCGHCAAGKSELKEVKKMQNYSWRSDCSLGVRPGYCSRKEKRNEVKSVLKMGFLGRLDDPVPRAMADSVVPMRPVSMHRTLSTSLVLGVFL